MQVAGVYADVRIIGSDKENIITYENLKNFQVVQTAGTSLPYVCGSFFTRDSALANFFQETNQIQVKLGSSEENAETFTLTLVNPQPPQNDEASSGWIICFGGFIGPSEYMADKISKGYNGTSLTTAKEIITKNFKRSVVTSIPRVNERPVTWRQTYDTTCLFLVNTLLHMDLRPSFPLFGFDKNLNFYIKSFDDVIKEEPKFHFVPYEPTEPNQIQHMRNFNANSFKMSYNLYSGYNKVTECYNSVRGIPKYIVDENVPILATTSEAEEFNSGNRFIHKIQSANVHDTYNEAFAYNTNKLVSMSSMQGCLTLANKYYPNICPLDLVKISTGDADDTHDGLYIIDTIVTNISFEAGNVTTYVYVTRDNKNHVENYVAVPKKKIKIRGKFLQDLSDAVASLRIATAMCREIMDGNYLDRLTAFGTDTKNNLLRMFSIAGITIDLTGQTNYLQNALLLGNSLMNTLLGMLLPYGLYETFRDFLVNKPTKRELLNRAIVENVPWALQDIVFKLIDSLISVDSALNSIAQDNGITGKGAITVADTSFETVAQDTSEERVNPIIADFENNTTGLDIPFPIIALNESHYLLPEKELREYVATETIANLTDLGYMSGFSQEDSDKFKDILLGKEELDYNMIDRINQNVGSILNYRFWGTYGAGTQPLYAWTYGDNTIFTKSENLTATSRLYNANYSPYFNADFSIKLVDGSYQVCYGDEPAERNEAEDVNSDYLAQLTSYYIKKNFKDKYKTLPCTKLVSATGNARLYFACPQKEKDIKFYINSKRAILDSFPIDLGYTDIYGNKIMYNVYFTVTGYNSNSTLFEIRQGV